MALFMTDGKLVDITLALTGRGFESQSPRKSHLRYHRAIIKLGTTGTINGFDIDTSHFNGKLACN
jgi:allantoicase